MKAALMAEPSQIGNDEPTDGFVGRMGPCPQAQPQTGKMTISVQPGGLFTDLARGRSGAGRWGNPGAPVQTAAESGKRHGADHQKKARQIARAVFVFQSAWRQN